MPKGRRRTSCCFNSSFRSERMVHIRFRAWQIVAVLLVAMCVATEAFAQGKLNVVTTTEDLASIARAVGGDRVSVEALARGYQDPHNVEPKPSFILKLQK